MIKLSLRVLAILLVVTASPWTWAQAGQGNGIDNPDWAEEAAPPPPEFSKDRAIALDMPSYVSVKVGIDPQTIVVGTDGVVRYVAVMTNASGTMNASFEGIRCASGQFKTYARYSASGTWSTVTDPQWRDISDNLPSKHTQIFARQAACDIQASNRRDVIVKALQGIKPERTTKSGRLQVDD